MSTVHLAGNVVVIDGRAIQRCLICGEKLLDSRGMMGPVNPDGSAPQIFPWGIGAWVEHEGNRWSDVGRTERPEFSGCEVPENCCLELVEM